MAMNIARTGTALGVGVVSGALTNMVAGGPIASQPAITWGAVAEGVAFAGGLILSFAAPFTMPSVADGLTAGGAALLGKRVTEMVVPVPAPAAFRAPLHAAQRISPAAVAGYGGPRPAVGSIVDVARRTIS